MNKAEKISLSWLNQDIRAARIAGIKRAKSSDDPFYIKPTKCSKGHPYNSTNTWFGPTGRKYCKICSRMKQHEWRRQHSKKNLSEIANKELMTNMPLVVEVYNKRREMGMSRMKLAKKAGVCLSTPFDWETGKFQPTLGRFEAIVNALGGQLVINWGDKT